MRPGETLTTGPTPTSKRQGTHPSFGREGTCQVQVGDCEKVNEVSMVF